MNDGEELWRQLVLGNENVKLVLSGHCLGDPANLKGATARLSSVRPSGSAVHQILANYQTCADMSCPEMPNQGWVASVPAACSVVVVTEGRK